MTALSNWLNSLSYGWVLGGLAVLMIGFYFLFNAIPRTKPVKGQLLCVVGMDLVTLLFFILTFSLRVSKMAAESGATPRTMPRLWAFLMLLASIGAYIAILRKDNKPDAGFDRWVFHCQRDALPVDRVLSEQRDLHRDRDDRHGGEEQASADPDTDHLVRVHVFRVQQAPVHQAACGNPVQEHFLEGRRWYG